MLLDNITRSLKFLAGAMAFAVAFAPLTAPVAIATDPDYSQPGGSEEGHFVRIGLGKSIVIRLPAEAKDVIVGDPGVVDAVVRTKNTAYLFARGIGQTNIFFFDAKGRQIMNVDLEVALDMMALQKLINRTNPGTRVTVDTVGNNVVLGGTASNAVEAAATESMAIKFAGDPRFVINAMKIEGGDQVMLKVRVVEVQRNVLKSLGVDLEGVLTIGNLGVALTSLTPAVGFSSLAASYANSDFSVDGAIRALESDGLMHTLAEPTLSAISGAPARFHAGGEVAYRECPRDPDEPCDITFRPIGVSLDFTPVVLSEGRISLKIRTEVSEEGEERFAGFPTIDTRSAETTVELPSGGSMVMAGLIKNITEQQVDGTPGLKNLPVLGALFRSRNFQQNATELAVIVTPYVVNPVHESQLAAPGDRLNLATDRQTILFGRLNKVYGTAGHHPDGVYHGNIGFIIE
ncbi:MAG: type II and III secretion system protein family protein [Rhizobiales bacterium]|nr:type II and III secretion system protein family protein [Hyphomicrobiales bacterium]